MSTNFSYPPVELRSGDRMNREEFHRLYAQTPEGFHAELIGGIVYVTASRTPISIGKPRALLCAPLSAYEAKTPGVEACSITTILLGEYSEPEPDLHLRILPKCGGKTMVSDDDYLVGAPEFIAEVAHSDVAIELYAKKDDYTRYGVREYLVICVKEQQLRWFDLAGGKELQPDGNGIYRIRTFPGLWIDGPALLAQDYRALMYTIDEGLATPEHAAFVNELAARRAKT